MKVLILAAGYATRLYPLTKEYPKPLLMVGNRPIIDHIIGKVNALPGVSEIIVITNSKFIGRFRGWKARLRSKVKISLVDDLTKGLSDRRGAIGDMNFAINKKRIRDDLLVIGGDNLFQYGLDKFMKFASSRKPSPVIGVYDIKDKKEAHKYGVIRLNRNKMITGFWEKPARPKSTLVGMCLYYFPGSGLNLLKDYLDSNTDGHDATGFYIDWLKDRVPVYGFEFSGKWFDIGDHKYYNRAKEEFAS